MKADTWKIPYERPEIPAALLQAGYPPLLSAVLALRGVRDGATARRLLESDENCLHDPMLMLGMEQAVARIRMAIRLGETVAVYGDYDVDGITSTCLLTDYLRYKGLNCLSYIPDRDAEGYGLNCAALDTLHEAGVNLVISVDCGITALDEVAYGRSLGMDMIITDHHECKSEGVPDAIAVIDCKQAEDDYPNDDLAGVGVALKLVCACEGDTEHMLLRYADLVAVGTVADVMPLTDENRYLVRRGLRKLADQPRPGLAAMLRQVESDPCNPTAGSISFGLSPRLNAAGRLGQVDMALQLLMSPDEASAAPLAAGLCDLNRQRQQIESDIWEDAKEKLARSRPEPDTPIVLSGEGWHQGVIGIAASRLAEQYSVPAIMICLTGEQGKGSCRSYGDFNLFAALDACSEHLIGFGGHALAAGLNIRRDQVDAFRQDLTRYYRSHHPEARPAVSCDLLIRDPALLSIENVSSLDRLEPYGNGNPRPNFCLSGVELLNVSNVGKDRRHLRVRIRLENSSFDGIFFSHTSEELGLREGDLADLAFTPQINSFRGHVSVQLMIHAARRHDSTALCREILNKNPQALWAAAPYCPVKPARNDCRPLWLHRKDHFPVGTDTEAVLRKCPPGMRPETYCICLCTLQEVGLLKSPDGQVFGAECAEIEGKADLESTALIRALRQMPLS